MDSAVCRRCPRSGGDIIAGPLRSGVELCIRRGRHSCDDGDGGRASLYCVCARGHGGLHRDFRSSVELRGSLRRERSVRGGSSEFSLKFILHVWEFLFRARLNGKVVAVCHPPIPPLSCLFSFFLSFENGLIKIRRDVYHPDQHHR